jgi:hypothetical protein
MEVTGADRSIDCCVRNNVPKVVVSGNSGRLFNSARDLLNFRENVRLGT